MSRKSSPAPQLARGCICACVVRFYRRTKAFDRAASNRSRRSSCRAGPSSASGRKSDSTPPRISTPPEPFAVTQESFVVQQAEPRAVASVLPGALETLSSLFASPTLPAGFESAKLPTLTERIVAHVRPTLGLAAPRDSAFSVPHSAFPPPPPLEQSSSISTATARQTSGDGSLRAPS